MSPLTGSPSSVTAVSPRVFFLGDGGRKPNCAGEGLAVLHAQVDDRGGIVHKEADLLCVRAVGHGQGVRTLGQGRGVNDPHPPPVASAAGIVKAASR